MVTLRADKRKNSYSLYLDIYYNKKRKLERLKLYVSQDYTKPLMDKNGNVILNKNGIPKKAKVLKEDRVNWELALKLRDERQNEINHIGTNFMNQISENRNFVRYFEDKLSEKNNTSYDAALIYLKKFKGDKVVFKDVDFRFVNNFKKFMLEEDGIIDRTVKTYLSRCNIIWKEAMKEHHISHNPFNEISLPKCENPEITYLVLDEVKKIAATEVDDISLKAVKKAFIFCCLTGLRKSDVVKLTWSNLHTKGKSKYIELRQTKSKKDILRIPLHITAIKILESLDKKSDKIFSNLKYTTIHYKIKKIGKMAGIDKDITFHTSRHSCATILYEHGVDLYTISKILGHSNIDITKIYTHLREDKKQEAIDKIPEIKITI